MEEYVSTILFFVVFRFFFVATHTGGNHNTHSPTHKRARVLDLCRMVDIFGVPVWNPKYVQLLPSPQCHSRVTACPPPHPQHTHIHSPYEYIMRFDMCVNGKKDKNNWNDVARTVFRKPKRHISISAITYGNRKRKNDSRAHNALPPATAIQPETSASR